MIEAAQYYTDQIGKVIFPINEFDTIFAIAALEETAMAMRDKSKETAEAADALKALLCTKIRTVSGDKEAVREVHQKIYAKRSL